MTMRNIFSVQQLVDTHAHLDSIEFSADLDTVVQHAFDAGVQTIITVAADVASSKAAIAIAERDAAIWATVGVHPHDAKNVSSDDLHTLCRLATHPQIVAVGEIGLDYYWDNSPREIQRQLFQTQLQLAADTGKPTVVHIRDKKGQFGAYDDALSLLHNWQANRQTPRAPGVLHCFSGNMENARTALDLGFYLGFDGPVTYPNAHSLRDIAAWVPLDRMLLETDCPYLAPQARRGKRNEPAYLTFVAAKIAEIRHVSLDQVIRTTTINAQQVFGLS